MTKGKKLTLGHCGNNFGKSTKQAQRLAELASKYTSVEITVLPTDKDASLIAIGRLAVMENRAARRDDCSGLSTIFQDLVEAISFYEKEFGE